MKRTEKFVDGILLESKKDLQKVAHEAVQEFLFERVKNKLVPYPYHSHPVLCKDLTQDINEKIDLFLVEEGYEK
tara:strand:- start:254 stop:475 length:222 start_codon:yes stop_codon:yes gene_type:complete